CGEKSHRPETVTPVGVWREPGAGSRQPGANIIPAMKRLSLGLVALLALAPATSASAQLLAAKDGPIVYGHHHLNTTNTETTRKFWIDALGGVLVKFGTNNTEI